ncbi:MAG TPA: phage tail tube protein [Sinorhizobium sp.]|nr:phage tail tube protein [Sinorhizobium sp.]
MGKDFGGKMSLRLSSGELISIRGTFNVSPTSAEISSVTNQDNSVDRISTPAAPRIEIVTADGGWDYEKLMNGPRFNATIVEEFTGVTHYMNGGFFSGRPVINRLNGEVSGLAIEGGAYNRSGG